MTDTEKAAADAPAEVLRAPADGVPPVVASAAALADTCARLAAGTGPVAIDAERASGHRYSQRAYLIQLRRTGAGTHLVDPTAVPTLEPLAAGLSGTEWILHAATQDLPCLAECGLRPDRLFDTELAARLLGLPRVGLAGLSEDVLGVGLAKGHGAADWSRRPLPDEWLTYAALDVELLQRLRDELARRLREAGRWEWAEQEFAHLTQWQPRERAEPWRRTAGLSRLRDPRDLATARELWLVRDAIARSADQPVGRILTDPLLIAMVRAHPADRDALAALPDMRPQRRRIDRWWGAIERARRLPAAELPDRTPVSPGPPPQRAWERIDPQAAARLTAVRAAVTARADELGIPPEVLVSPDPVRAVVWEAGGPWPEDEVRRRLRDLSVREWQADLVAPLIAAALTQAG